MQQARGKETRQRLKDAAIRLVSEGGHETASARAIAVTSDMLPNIVIAVDCGALPGPASTYASTIGTAMIRTIGTQ